MVAPAEHIEAAARTAIQHWDLDVKNITLASRSENVVFKVISESEQAYALRFHRPGYNSIGELESEVIWSDALNLADIPTPAHVATKSGTHYVPIRWQGSPAHQVGLIRWIPGELLIDRIKQASEHDAKQYFQDLGSLLASLHNHTSTWQAPANFERRSWDADGLLGPDPLWGKFWESPVLTNTQKQYLLNVREHLHDQLLQLSTEHATFGLIHADLHPRNVIVHGHDSTQEMQAIDFDDCGYGWHYYDIAVALNEFNRHAKATEFQTALLQGYRSERQLIDPEHHLPLFFLIRKLVSLGWISARPELSSTEEIVTQVPAIIGVCEEYLG
ncbi:MAG: phosphotransferase [Pseudomonadales bacterium]|nr:phosphotransferase [Pseudomonadales bacterium]